jgi:hypothetical protein
MRRLYTPQLEEVQKQNVDNFALSLVGPYQFITTPVSDLCGTFAIPTPYLWKNRFKSVRDVG